MARKGQTRHTDDGWTARLARHRTGLAALSFAESTAVPIPLETVVLPLMLGHPARALRIALYIWIGCLAGAALFYCVGGWLADLVVLPGLETLGLRTEFDKITGQLQAEGLFWTVFLISFSPAPMQLATLGAGATGGNFAVFLAAIALSRGLRYFGLAVLAQILGESIARLNLPTGRLVIAAGAALLAAWGIHRLI